jgi:hypothetical protein
VQLIHLTAVGTNVAPASVEFAPRLTVIFGASETGKSYIVEAIDFMLGGRTLRDLPEAAGYSRMLLGLRFDSGEVVTLARPLVGGRVEVFDEDLRELPRRPADQTLAAQHNRRSDANLSRFLLNELGASEAQVRRNQYNALQSLSFRNLAHLCLVDETKIQSRTSPVESGNFISRTPERAVLKLLLEGEDDSALATGEDPGEFRRVNRGKIEILDRALAQLQPLLEDAPDRPALLDQLARLNAGIAGVTNAVEESLRARDGLIVRQQDLQTRTTRSQARGNDLQALIGRFELLRAQYESDLQRLALVREAGTFLGYFAPGVCVFCGADPEHQQAQHAVEESTLLADAVDAEVQKTQSLRADLLLTIESLYEEREGVMVGLDAYRAHTQEVMGLITAVDQDLQPGREELAQLIDERSLVEKYLGVWERVAELEALRAAVAGDEPEPVDQVSQSPSTAAQQSFSQTLKSVLEAWQVPGAESAFFSFDGAPDVVLQQRRREDRGKGMRSILHAGFTVALSEYCANRERPHPGFVALDTPVLTYRDPERGPSEDESSDERFSPSVSASFYSYLQTQHSGQVLIMENQNPPRVVADDCLVVYFTGQAGLDRSGFYPI